MGVSRTQPWGCQYPIVGIRNCRRQDWRSPRTWLALGQGCALLSLLGVDSSHATTSLCAANIMPKAWWGLDGAPLLSLQWHRWILK